MTTIKLKNGSGAPTAGDLVQGEPALDLTNKRLYTEDSGGTVIEVGTNPGTDVTFADNRKAIFGAGSDLQIFHDGSSTSFIQSSTSNIEVKVNGGGNFKVGDEFGNHLFIVNDNGDVQLKHGSTPALKLATTSTGIDVTGTVTADGLTVDGNTTNLNYGKTFFTNGIGTNKWQIWNDDGGTDKFQLVDGDGHLVLQAEQSGDISFYEDTGTTAKLFWDASAERLGIGTSSPTSDLSVGSTTTSSGDIALRTTKTATVIAPSNTAAGGMDIDVGWVSGGQGPLTFSLSGAEKARIDSSGRAGFGTTNIDGQVTAYANSDTVPGFSMVSDANHGMHILHRATDGDFSFEREDAGTKSEFMRVDRSSGNVYFNEKVGIGTTSPGRNLEIAGTGSDVGLNIVKNTVGTVRFAYDSTGPYILDEDSNPFRIYTGGSERVRIDSSGNVGIGTSSPAEELTVGSGGSNYIGIGGDGVNASGIRFYRGASTVDGLIEVDANEDMIISMDNTGALGTGQILFKTGNTERLRIDSSGNLLVGTSSLFGNEKYAFGFEGSARNGISLRNTSGSGTPYMVAFQWGSTTVGDITSSSTATVYNTTSDQRLKENIVDAPSASDDIDAIQVRSFDWKADGSHQKYGMVAQELNTVAPDAVTVPEDESKMQSVDYSKLVPMLVKEIQSLRARVAQLEGD